MAEGYAITGDDGPPVIGPSHRPLQINFSAALPDNSSVGSPNLQESLDLEIIPGYPEGPSQNRSYP